MSDYLSAYLRSAKGETRINSVSCGAACSQIKNPAGGDGAWCYQRMHMLHGDFLLWLLSFLLFSKQPIRANLHCCGLFMADWVCKWGLWRTEGPQKNRERGPGMLSPCKIHRLSGEQNFMKETKVLCGTWGKAWITVSSSARIPTAILSSFSTERRGETAYCTVYTWNTHNLFKTISNIQIQKEYNFKYSNTW